MANTEGVELLENDLRYVMALRTHTRVILAALLFASSTLPAAAKQSDRSVQHVVVGVRPIVALAVSPVDALFAERIDRADLVHPTDRSIVAQSTWSMTTNASDLDLTARLDAPMPDGLHLEISAASLLGQGRRSVRISSLADKVIVSSIGRGREKGTPIEVAVIGDIASVEDMLTRTITFALRDPASGTSDSVSRVIRIGSGQESAIALAPAR